MSFLAFVALALGAIIGSFLNVVIHRVPEGESIVSPPSHCPACGARVRPWDNIPVVSWIILLGRCRDCRSPISMRYPLVELATALLFFALYQRTGPSLLFIPLAAIIAMTIALIYIDLEIQILPDVIDLPGIVIGVGLGILNAGAIVNTMTLSTTWIDSVVGALLGGGLLLAVGLAYKLWRGIEGMGFGDVKMLAMIGAVSGWRAVVPIVFIASFAGALIGVGLALTRRTTLQFALPFGVFLGLGFLVMLFFGNTLSGWYFAILAR